MNSLAGVSGAKESDEADLWSVLPSVSPAKQTDKQTVFGLASIRIVQLFFCIVNSKRAVLLSALLASLNYLHGRLLLLVVVMVVVVVFGHRHTASVQL